MDESGDLRIRPDGISWRESDGEIVVLDLASNSYLQLNSSAAVLWKSLGAGATPTSLAAELIGAFDVADETAQADVAAFLALCRSRNLLAE